MGFMSAALAYEKLNDFKSAYAYILLADGLEDEAWDDTIGQHLSRIKEKMSYNLSEGVYHSRPDENRRWPFYTRCRE